MDAAQQQRVQELTQEVITRFATEFTKAYTQCLITKVKLEIEGDEPSGFQLESAPLQDEPLKIGTLSKQGGFFKNWKVRHFIAYNEKDNFRIDYLEKEGGKVKGSIGCCGYTPEFFDKDEEAKLGEFGIKLVGASNRRTWYIRASSKEERDEWYQVFRTCCWKARPLRNTDSAIADAFDIAYWKVRWWYCLWGSYNPWGSEDERLCDLMLCILNREVIYDVVSKIPSGPARSTMESAIRSPIEMSVKATAGGSWTSSVSACSGMKATLEASIKSLLTPLIEQEKGIKDKIVSTAGGIVNPVVADIGGKLLSPVSGHISVPLGKAFGASALIFDKKMKEVFSNADSMASREKFERAVKYMDGYCWWFCYKAFKIMWDLCRDELSKLPSMFWENMGYWTIGYMAEDAISEIYHNACYTFTKRSKDVDQSQYPVILEEVNRMYIHDCRVSARKLLVAILRKFLDTPVQDLMMKPLLTAVAPVQDVIDAIPVPGLATLLNLPDMVTECIERIVDEALGALVDAGFVASMEAELAAIKI